MHRLDYGMNEPARSYAAGKALITDGPYLENKEHIGGFWIVEAADLNEALAWGRKCRVACRVPVEVRAVWRPEWINGTAQTQRVSAPRTVAERKPALKN